MPWYQELLIHAKIEELKQVFSWWDVMVLAFVHGMLGVMGVNDFVVNLYWVYHVFDEMSGNWVHIQMQLFVDAWK